MAEVRAGASVSRGRGAGVPMAQATTRAHTRHQRYKVRPIKMAPVRLNTIAACRHVKGPKWTKHEADISIGGLVKKCLVKKLQLLLTDVQEGAGRYS